MIVICLEGCHGCGKSSLCEKFQEAGYEVLDEAFLDMPEYALHPQSLLDALHAAEVVASCEPSLVDLRTRAPGGSVHVVGDLHGCASSLRRVLTLCGAPSPKNAIVFNGDFVDRGEHSTEVLAVLVLLKLASPAELASLKSSAAKDREHMEGEVSSEALRREAEERSRASAA